MRYPAWALHVGGVSVYRCNMYLLVVYWDGDKVWDLIELRYCGMFSVAAIIAKVVLLGLKISTAVNTDRLSNSAQIVSK